MIDFRSDNVHSVPDQIINALVDANKGTISSYGGDQLTKKACDLLSKTFNKDLSSFFVNRHCSKLSSAIKYHTSLWHNILW